MNSSETPRRPPPILVAEIPISAKEAIRVTREGSATKLRVWFLKHGEWRPSANGLEIPLRSYDAVAAALQSNRHNAAGEGPASTVDGAVAERPAGTATSKQEDDVDGQ